MKRIPPYRQLGFKLAFGTIFLVSLVIVATGIISLRTAEQQFSHLLFQEFSSARNVLENFLAFVEQTSLIVSKSVAQEKNLIALLDSRASVEALTRELRSLADKHSADVLVLLDMEGRILAQSDTMDRNGEYLTSFHIVQQAVQGTVSSTAIVQDRENFILYGTYYSINPATGDQAIVMAGYALNNDFVDHIWDNSHIEISLVRERSVIASSLRRDGRRITVIPIPYLEYQSILNASELVVGAHFLGEDYFISATSLPGMQANMSGSLLMAHSRHDLDRAREILVSRYVIIFLSSLLIGNLVVVFISRSLLRPVKDLTLAAGQLAAGDYTRRITRISGDELGMMAGHFNRMAETIQAKNDELQQYSQGLELQVRKRTSEIEKQSLLIDNILASTHDLAIGATDLALDVSYFNPAAERILGISAAEIRGKSVFRLFPPGKEFEAVAGKIQAEVEEKGFHRFEINRIFNGEKQCLEGQIIAMGHGTGQPGGHVFLVRDVTLAREMEERVRASHKFEAFSNLAGGLAHDLNNSLQVIMGNLELIETSEEPGETRILLEQASKATQQASLLGQRMWDLSDVRLGNTKPLDLGRLLVEIITKVSDGSFEMETDLATDLWPLFGDEALLGEALGNMLENAREAILPGGRISVTAKNHPGDRAADDPESQMAKVMVVITDNGQGIAPETLDRIFDPYFTTKPLGSYKGRGLSLATSMATIRKHGGRILVESEEGRGTTFFINLPVPLI